MKLLEHPISREELKQIASERFITLVKAVVDVEQEIMVIDADMHADEEAWMIDNGSKQENLWGINLLVDSYGDDFVQFDSMINLRPSSGNMTRGVENKAVQEVIKEIVGRWINS